MKKITLIKNLFTKSALTLLTLLTMGIGNAWGYYSAKMNVYSSPSTGGYVYVGNSSNCSASSCGTKTSDNASVKNKARFPGLKTTLNAIILQTNDNNSIELVLVHTLTTVLFLIHPQTKTIRNIHSALYLTIS